MIKKGFTLQELLISLAIVGIVAAIAAPAITALMPDKKKAMYMKAYNTLTNVTNEIINDPSLYWIKYDASGEPENENILENTDAPIDYEPCEGDWSCSGTGKFPAIFATKVNYVDRSKVLNTVTINTSDGMYWLFMADGLGVNLLLDVDSRDDSNCIYGTCDNPDRFSFRISNDGQVVPLDKLGKAFLRNPTDMHSIKKDKELADKL